MRRLKEAETFILDLDGTVYLSETLLPGAREFLEHLVRAGKRYVFITNNSSKTAEEYVTKLTRLGLRATIENVYTSLDATLAWLARQEGRRAYAVGTASFVEKIRAAGYEITDERPDWVVLGFDTTITYDKIRRAAKALRGGARFVATHPDINCPTAEGPVPDTGAFIKLFEAATGKSPVICGKPYAAMVEGALGRLGGSAERAAIIGDRLYTDMAMGRAAGILAVLVLSGETRREDIGRAPEEHRPDLVFQDLAGALEALCGSG
jgi:HAD superfamily hydrolase (TIGR01457 family)